MMQVLVSTDEGTPLTFRTRDAVCIVLGRVMV